MGRDVAIVIDLLVGLAVGLHVVVEDELKQRTLQDNENYSEAALDDSRTEHEPLSEQRNMYLVL